MNQDGRGSHWCLGPQVCMAAAAFDCSTTYALSG